MVRFEGIIVPITMTIASVAVVAVAILISSRHTDTESKAEAHYSGVLSRSDSLRLKTRTTEKSAISGGSAASLFVKAPARSE